MSLAELVLLAPLALCVLAVPAALFVLATCAYDVWRLRDDPWLADPAPVETVESRVEFRPARLRYGASVLQPAGQEI